MEKRKIQHSDLTVSKICLGTMTFGEQNTEKEGHEQMDFAIDKGINFFDTAELYAVPSTPENNGKTEEIIGTWFKKSGKRKDVILATKVTGPSGGLQHVRNHNLNYKPETIREALQGSFKRLQTDYVDIYQLHWPERQTNMFGKLGFEYNPNDPWQDNFVEVLETMKALIDEGKIRHWGLSNETPWGVMHVLALAEKLGLPKPVTIQNPYNLLNRSYEIGLAEISMREKVGLLAYSPMAFGLLSGKYHHMLDKPKDRLNKFKNLDRYNNTNCWDATNIYLKLAEENGLSLAQMSLAFVTQQAFTVSNIVGATTLEQLEQNIDSADLVLTDDILGKINSVHKRFSNPAP